MDREQALRWLIAHRRPEVSIERAVQAMCIVLPRDLATMQLLRRIAEEENAEQPVHPLNWRQLSGLPPRG